MGLDAVELVLEVEERWGLSLCDEEVQNMATVGDLVAIIQSRIEAAQSPQCRTLPAMLAVRQATREATDDAHLSVRPLDRLADRLTPAQRKRLWAQLPQLIGTTPPPLRRPRWLRRVLHTTLAALLAAAIAVAIYIDQRIWPLSVASAASLAAAAYAVTGVAKFEPPPHMSTFWQIALRIVGRGAATKSTHRRDAGEILETLRPIIVDTLGVDADEITFEARLVDDLGMA